MRIRLIICTSLELISVNTDYTFERLSKFKVSWKQVAAFRLSRHHLFSGVPPSSSLTCVAGDIAEVQEVIVFGGELPLDYIFLVRHGESKANEEGIEAGCLDYPLSKKGKKQARFISLILSKLKVQAVYSSPILRTIQTAEILGRPHKLKVKKLEELTEAKIKREFFGRKGRHHILESPADYLETYGELTRRIDKAVALMKTKERGT